MVEQLRQLVHLDILRLRPLVLLLPVALHAVLLVVITTPSPRQVQRFLLLVLQIVVLVLVLRIGQRLSGRVAPMEGIAGGPDGHLFDDLWVRVLVKPRRRG